MPDRILRYGIVGAVLVAAVVILTTLVQGTLAQDATETPTTDPDPTGELVVVPGLMQVGQTTLAVGFQVVPLDLEVKIEYSEHFVLEEESCDAESAGATPATIAPTWVTLKACSVGEGRVRLVEADTGSVIQEVRVAVSEAGPMGQADITITFGSIPSSLTVGDSDRFNVEVTGLDRNTSYELITTTLHPLILTFNAACTDVRETADITNTSSATRSYGAYGCRVGRAIVWSYLNVDGSAVAATDISNEGRVRVVPPPSTPTSTPTPTPPPPTDPEIDISGLGTTLEEGDQDTFTVTASDLDSSRSYAVEVTTSDSDIGFNSTCSDRQENFTVSGRTSQNERITLYACDTSGGTVTATLFRGSTTLATDSQYVRVTAPPSPPPQPTPTSTPPPPPPRPTITIARHSNTPSSVTEGDQVRFTLRVSRAPAANLTVNVRVTETPQGAFLTGTVPTQITIARDSTTADLILQTEDDAVDEPNGTISPTVLPGDGYTVRSPSSASVTVLDNDRPPAPTGLRANGHLVNGKITLRWNAVPGATGYNVRYAEEVCVAAGSSQLPGVPDATCGLGDPPMWSMIPAQDITTQEITIDGDAVLETSLEFTPPDPLRSRPCYNSLERDTSDINLPCIPWPLYRVEVQAVVVDNSDWSGFALVFPTSSLPIPHETRVAANHFNVYYQPKRHGSHEYGYTLCKGTITTDVAWSSWDTDEQGDLVRDAATVAAIVTDIEAAIERWETTVRWVADGANIIATTATESDTCPGSYAVRFIRDRDVLEMCGGDPLALACHPLPHELSNILLRHTPMTAQRQPTRWDAPRGDCSLLHAVALHEAGHVFGLGAGHSKTPQAVMYYSLSGQLEPFCGPQVYDVVAMMVNYQSR